ncbi:MAG TPA: hypothetical protein PK819_03600 [Thermomicrobiales bacterium]|nr:hypothetical protein [Thermomicrobiales bacterium]
MARIRIFGLLVILPLAFAFNFASSVSAQSEVSLTLDLVTCNVIGTANSIEILGVFDANDCDSSYYSWDQEPSFLLNGTPMDGGDGANSVVFAGLISGESYTLIETNGIGVFDGGYTFIAPDSDLELFAVLDQFYVPDSSAGGQDDGSGTGEAVDQVTGLPNTGSGTVVTPGSGIGALLIVALLMAALGCAIYPRQTNSDR